MGSGGLIADIGATNARFALAGENGIRDQITLACADYPGPAEAVEEYLRRAAPAQRPSRASIAIAGPVAGDWFEMTNHPWRFSAEETRKALRLEKLRLLNDFEAIALAVPHLTAGDVKKIGGGEPRPQSTIGVIGPGTGLGVAALFWDGTRYRANPCEGGHVTMPARTQREFDLFRVLSAKYRHISAERVCSGKGLVNVYNAIRELDRRGDLPDREPSEIAEAALQKNCAACEEALSLMMIFLGRVAGNLALSLGAHGGIYVAGGIPAKLGEYFFHSEFQAEFTGKGRMEAYLDPIPTYLITRPEPGLLGLQHQLEG